MGNQIGDIGEHLSALARVTNEREILPHVCGRMLPAP